MGKIKKAAFFLFVGMMPSFVLADTVEINAHGGVIPNDATADVKIVAGGEGDGVTLANATGTTEAGTLKTATAATVKIGDGQKLDLKSYFNVQYRGNVSLFSDGSSADLSLVGEGNSELAMPQMIRAQNGGWLRFTGLNLFTRDNNTLTPVFNGVSDNHNNRGNISFSNGVYNVALQQSSGICEIHDGTVMTNRFDVGNQLASFYQDGGDVYVLSFRNADPGPGSGTAYLGKGGSFYYNFSSVRENCARRFLRLVA